MRKLLNKRNVLTLLSIVFFLIAWNRSINLLYGMFALLAATLILGLLLPRRTLRGVTVARTLPSTAFEDEDVDIIVAISNKERTTRSMVEVVDVFPAAGPDQQSPMTFVATLPGRASRSYTYRLSCFKRGEYQIGPLRLRTAYPLGIATAERASNDSITPFLVYPRVFEITGLPLVSGGSTPMSGLEAASKAGGSEEFFGTREYRRGDSLRYIHWPSSARHGELIVKEFEVRAATEATIVLDLHRGEEIGEGKDTTLEYAVKIAASIAQYSLRRGHSVQLAGYGDHEHIVPSARGEAHLGALLEELARVAANGTTPYSAAITRAADLMRDGSTAVLIMTASVLRDREFPLGINLLLAKRLRFLCIVIDDGSFRMPPRSVLSSVGPALLDLRGSAAAVYTIARGDDLPGVFAQ